MGLAGICFALMIGCVKVVRQDFSALEVIVFRGIVAVPLSILIVYFTPGRPIKINNKRVFSLRLLFGLGAMYCYYTAAHGLALADLSLITRLQPILIALLAPVLLGAQERSDGRIWVLLVAGVVGCLVLLAPQLMVGSLWGLWAVGAMLSSALAHLALRAMGPTERTQAVVLWTQVGIFLVTGLMLALATDGLTALPSPTQWLWIIGLGSLATLGQLLMTRAYALDQASVVAGASNLTPLWAAIVDLVLFSTILSMNAFIGGVLIVGASLSLLFRPKVREKHQDASRESEASRAL